MSLNFLSRRDQPGTNLLTPLKVTDATYATKKKQKLRLVFEAQTEASLGGFELSPFLKETKPQPESGNMLTSLHSNVVQQKVKTRCSQKCCIPDGFSFCTLVSLKFCLNHPKMFMLAKENQSF